MPFNAFKIEPDSPLVCFYSQGIFSHLSAGKEIVNDRFSVRVFLEINNGGRKVRELRKFFMELLY